MKKFFKFIFKFVIVIVVIVAIGVGVLHFTTPATFGLDDFVIADGITVRDMGIADTSNLELGIMAYKLLLSPSAGTVVDSDSVATAEDFSSVQDVIESEIASTGAVNYSDLIEGRLEFDTPVELNLSKGEMTALLNMVFENDSSNAPISTKSIFPQKRFDYIDMNYQNQLAIGTSYQNTELPDVEDLEITRDVVLMIFSELNIYIESTTPEVVGNRIYMTTVFSIELPAELKEIIGALPIDISEKIYITSKNEMKLENGELSAIESQGNEFQVNTMSVAQSELLMGALLGNLGVDKSAVSKVSDEYIVIVGGVMGSIYNNLGNVDSITNDGISITTHSK